MKGHAPTSPPRIRISALLPSALILLLALTSAHHPDPCQSTDGPQFACWLEDQ